MGKKKRKKNAITLTMWSISCSYETEALSLGESLIGTDLVEILLQHPKWSILVGHNENISQQYISS